MTESRRRQALVTGASAGIGRALAQRLARDHAVLATGRRPRDQVASAPTAEVTYLVADQSDPEVAANAVVAALDVSGQTRLDLAILNAGVGWVASEGAEDRERVRETLDVNLLGPIAMAQALQAKLEAASGRLVLVGSVARAGAPGFASYAASKAALNGLARSLAEEWRGRIAVQAIHPGPTQTEMHARAGHHPGRAARFFIPADMMARMMLDAITAGRSPVTLSYAAWARRGFSRAAA